jgi:hypothetical protein
MQKRNGAHLLRDWDGCYGLQYFPHNGSSRTWGIFGGSNKVSQGDGWRANRYSEIKLVEGLWKGTGDLRMESIDFAKLSFSLVVSFRSGTGSIH